MVPVPRSHNKLIELGSNANDPSHKSTRQCLEAISNRYHPFPTTLLVINNEGPNSLVIADAIRNRFVGTDIEPTTQLIYGAGP